jgi:hypothetical protein
VTDTGVSAQTNTFITHLDEVEAFLRKDADTHMRPGSAANRALQIDSIGKTRDARRRIRPGGGCHFPNYLW